MNKKELIFKLLKTKAKDFGFTKEELKSIAATLADNLTLDEDASEDEQTAAVTQHVDAYLPLLKSSQSFAQRVLKEWKSKHPVKEPEEDEDEEDEDEDDEPAPKQKSKGKKAPKPDSEMKKLLDAVTALTSEVKTLKADKTATSRKERLERELKDTGKFGESILKAFSKMNFDSDEDFDEYLNDITEQAKDFKKDEKAKGLGGTPPGKGNVPAEKELSDELLKEIVG
jgi:ATP-dependent exoDNAse (exonuclease V) beta subunit